MVMKYISGAKLGARLTSRTVPPYWPIFSSSSRPSGAALRSCVSTSGFSGSRSFTGGSSPAATRSASIGASR